MAYEIFELDHVFQVSDPTLRFKFHAIKNGSSDPPRVGDLLIWRGGTPACLVSVHGRIVRTHHVNVFIRDVRWRGCAPLLAQARRTSRSGAPGMWPSSPNQRQILCASLNKTGRIAYGTRAQTTREKFPPRSPPTVPTPSSKSTFWGGCVSANRCYKTPIYLLDTHRRRR